ncbi:MAG TPA: hypothetical protein PKD24_09200 [Pyrinomonadaceae bacterium]|nr:hypothetical protein [Pyrinomonadaceae bacterium]HMP65755.1 hypothetical protein [Pyrinomonadaceae bacterium]
MSITQEEFDYLIEQEKIFDELDPIELAPAPKEWTRSLTAPETKEKFLLDFRRSGFELTKYTYNKRYRQTIILVRYCSTGRHTNPDGEPFSGPHVHLYREGFSDKFAFPISELGIDHNDRMDVVLEKLLAYCNVTSSPMILPPLY